MKFNVLKRNKNQILNYEGERAIRLSPEMELYTAVVTAGLGGFFYTNERTRIERIRSLIAKVDPVFVAKLAVYARTKMYLRSIPLVLITELARIHKGDTLVSNAVYQVIQRADEITELLACYSAANERKGFKKLNKLSKQLQKGIGKSFNKFDEYQFAKYDRPAEITLRDALFLTRPKAESKEKQQLFDKIAKQELTTPYTWEVELSLLGQSEFASNKMRAAAFSQKWEELIDSGKIGYMALLRNLRNILEAKVSYEAIKTVGERLSSESEVERSKQLPFRFLSAYREIQNVKSEFTSFILDALELAVIHSVSNLNGFGLSTRVLIACDVSASMYQSVSSKSSIRLYDIGLTLGMMMNLKSRNVITGIFGTNWKTVNLPSEQVLSNTQKLNKLEGNVGYSTNGYKVIESLIRKQQVTDKVMMFTDCQMWNSSGDGKKINVLWRKYKSEVAPYAKLYLFDLAGYGRAPLKVEGNDVYLIAGWSDKIFDVLNALEKGDSILSEIKRVEL